MGEGVQASKCLIVQLGVALELLFILKDRIYLHEMTQTVAVNGDCWPFLFYLVMDLFIKG